jgi:hypothetical protein
VGGEYLDVDADDLYGTWLLGNFVWAPAAAMFRRDSLAAIGGFPSEFGPTGDYAVYLAFARENRVVDHGEIVARYRQHDASMSRNAARMLRSTLAVLARERPVLSSRHRAIFARSHGSWCDWYGEQIVDGLRQDWRAGRFGRAQILALMTLLRHCPSIAARHLRRKSRRLLSAEPRGTGDGNRSHVA